MASSKAAQRREKPRHQQPWAWCDAYHQVERDAETGERTPRTSLRAAHRVMARARGRQVSALDRRTRDARLRAWVLEVSSWLHQRHLESDLELINTNEALLVHWFREMDVDGSGTLDTAEMSELLRAAGLFVSQEDVHARFARVGLAEDEHLNPIAFARIMQRTGRTMLRADPEGQLRRSNTELHIMTARRQRMIDDVMTPSKRPAFASPDVFERKYGIKASEQPPMPKGRGRSVKVDAPADVSHRDRPTMAQILLGDGSIDPWTRAERAEERAAKLSGKARLAAAGQTFSPSGMRSGGPGPEPRAEGRAEVLAEGLLANWRPRPSSRRLAPGTSGERRGSTGGKESPAALPLMPRPGLHPRPGAVGRAMRRSESMPAL
eukprot:CAMPEP_0196671432 /NCGR_PEP_ID=MMETSP1090-20130531/1797_1 /TAXON_ID=37098 /ORGANISM="Isochrysis sp, Strain CCMP1244" /LENGTH=378 /DNA_ID=CAMNT_0042009089 /DNA_START=25 /DNA_END=1161 /DNA_ORIENTATION=-